MIAKNTITILLLCIGVAQGYSLILPREETRLNHILVVFFSDEYPKKGQLAIEIARGRISSNSAFIKSRFKTLVLDNGRVTANLPSFGEEYTWRVVPVSGSRQDTGVFHHFSVLTSKFVDTSRRRLRIIKSALRFQHSYVFLDANKALYDMRGRPVWFLPNVDTEISLNENVNIRDIKVTPQGTITFLLPGQAYEIDWAGRVLWKKPASNTDFEGRSQQFHHEFTRRDNGNYMLMGDEVVDVLFKEGKSADSDLFFVTNSKDSGSKKDFESRKMLFPTIVEYDSAGRLIQSLKTSRYFMNTYLVNTRSKDGSPDCNPHGNSFYFDKASQCIYISFRNINRIIKVRYPGGEMISAYGEEYGPGKVRQGTGLFSYQHCCRISQDGCLYLFDNNSFAKKPVPKIEMMEEKRDGGIKLIWEFDGSLVEKNMSKKKEVNYSTGGSVEELPDKSFLVNMGTGDGRVFIVGRDKHIYWDAMAERWDESKKKWQIIPQYRASFLARQTDLEKYILSSEMHK